jgi:ethanolamine ammonia-lyase small subunit
LRPIASSPARDPWQALAAHTDARIALGRAGGSLRTESLLEFRLAHAGARDAVHTAFDVAGLETALHAAGFETERLASRVTDKQTYLLRPDLGRKLSPASIDRLEAARGSWGRRDLALLISDGLAATAAAHHAAETATELARILGAAGWTIYPLFLVPFARVKLQDAVGGLLHARHSLILLGERPGLGAHDSLGAYLTYEPGETRTDADRNCVSNIREGGLPPRAAARKLADLLVASRQLALSGTALREGTAPLAMAAPETAPSAPGPAHASIQGSAGNDRR